MDKKTEALKLAQKALEELLEEQSYWWQEVESDIVKALEKAESACKQALAEQPAQQQEPVAWYDEEYDCAYTAAELDGGNIDGLLPLYTSPASKPLSGYINAAGINANDSPHIVVEKLERAIEANLKEKNGHI